MKGVCRKLLVLCLLLCHTALDAQEMTRRRIDLGFGLGHGAGGPDYTTDRTLLAGSILLSGAMRQMSGGALVLAGNVSGNMVWRRSDCIGGWFGSCSGFPSDLSLGVLAGWSQREDQWGSLRVLAGPAWFTASDKERGFGITSRIDFARQLTSRYAFVVWTQAQMRPNVGGDFLAMATAGIGVRASRIVRLPRSGPNVPALPPPPGTKLPPL